MHMVWHDGARPNRKLGLLDVFTNAEPDGVDLSRVEANSRTFERFLGGETQYAIVRSMSHRMAFGRLGGSTESIELVGADELGPGTARVVGKPKAVRAKDD